MELLSLSIYSDIRELVQPKRMIGVFFCFSFLKGTLTKCSLTEVQVSPSSTTRGVTQGDGYLGFFE